jgi:hypothetical protein
MKASRTRTRTATPEDVVRTVFMEFLGYVNASNTQWSEIPSVTRVFEDRVTKIVVRLRAAGLLKGDC